MAEMIRHEFPGKDDKMLLSQIESMFDLKYRNLLSLFEPSSTKDADDLDEAVLKAFLKANECHKMARLCLTWNRVDIARNFIFNDSFNGEVYRIIKKKRLRLVIL